MLFSFLISIATAVGTTVGSPTPADSLYEDFSTSEKPYLITPDDYSLLSSNPGDLTFDSSPTLGFDDIPFNDQASSELSDQFSSALETPSCNLGKRDGAACSVESAPQGRLEIPDLLQMGSTVIKENPLLAPITIEIGDDSPGKCANLVYPLNLCCKGPLGTLAGGLYPLVVYETIDECRPGSFVPGSKCKTTHDACCTSSRVYFVTCCENLRWIRDRFQGQSNSPTLVRAHQDTPYRYKSLLRRL